MKYLFTILLFFSLILSAEAQFKVVQESSDQTPIEHGPLLWHPNQTNRSNNGTGIIPKMINFEEGYASLKVSSRDKSGKPTQFLIQRKRNDGNVDVLDQANSYFIEISKVTDISNQFDGLLEVHRNVDDYGHEHLKTNQTHKGIEIYGAELIFHAENGFLSFVNGDYVETNELDLHPIPSKKKTEIINQIAIDFHSSDLDVSKISNQYGVDFKQSEAKLIWYTKDFDPSTMKLAWQVIHFPNIADRMELVIDANTGEYLQEINTVCKFHNHAHDEEHTCVMDGPATASATDLLNVTRTINTYDVGGTFYLIDATKSMFSSFGSNLPNDPKGTIWTLDGGNNSPQSNNFDVDHISSSNNNWGSSPEGVSAHYNAEQAYEYFKNVHQRESINGSGGNIVSIVNVTDENDNSMDNAFWNGFAIFYGNGAQAFKPLGRALDVAGHEMSHGVVQNTANLEYYGESGAINESCADIFGAMIDRNDWQMGEDVVNTNVFPSGALRDLQDPHNGAATNDFQRGWQPKHTNEQFTGQEDNNGVHINSGIPNHAYYLFATDIGKSKAEKIWYHALVNNLTKSSQFIDLRNGVINSATAIHGQNSAEVDAAKNAFSAVGIGAGSGTNNQNDAEVNPGEDLLLFSGEGQNQLHVASLETNMFVYNPLSETAHISKPSITDDGSFIVFVGEDKMLYGIGINWETGETTEQVIESNPIWRNAVVSKDGSRVAAVTDTRINEIRIFDYGLGAWNDFTLYNPTFTEGIETGNVDFADAMEFDITGEILMYDAQSTISSGTAGEITYWDIGFVEVWNNAAQTWRLGNISKLFSGLPEGVSVGNPTYSKNSPYIVAFDFIEGSDYSILGTNSENGDVGLIHDNDVLGYPSYSKTDGQIAFDRGFFQNGSLAGYDLGFKNMAGDKIQGVDGTEITYVEQFRWPTWFSNGERILSDVNDASRAKDFFTVYPNPAKESIQILFDSNEKTTAIVTDIYGKAVLMITDLSTGDSIDIRTLAIGQYIIQIEIEDKVVSQKIMKI